MADASGRGGNPGPAGPDAAPGRPPRLGLDRPRCRLVDARL